MKNLYCIIPMLLFWGMAAAQNIGIGTSAPLQTLDVNGPIKIGFGSNNQPGSIRYSAGSFEGGNGNSWKSLEGVPSKSIIMAQAADTAALKTAGFSVLRLMDIWDTAVINVPANYPGSWTVGLPLSSSAVTPPVAASNEAVIYNNRFIYWGTDGYLYAYDIAGQLWIRLPNISPLGIRNSCGITLVGNEIFVTGGWRFSGGFTVFNTCAKYNLATNTWSAIANLPVNSCYHATAAIGNDIYLLDGASSFSTSFDYSKKMYRYNTLSNTWSADLAVAATPDYLLTNSVVAWNNKIVYQTGNLRVYTYDPITHINTLLTPAIPPDAPYLQDYAMTLSGNKLYIAGSIADTTTLEPVPNGRMAKHMEVDLSNGSMIQLNTCQLQEPQLYIIEYNAANDRFYARGDNNFYTFNRAGSQACDVQVHRKAYWSYMKKN